MFGFTYAKEKNMFALKMLDCFAGFCGEFGVHPLAGFAVLVLVLSVVTVARNPRTYCGN